MSNEKIMLEEEKELKRKESIESRDSILAIIEPMLEELNTIHPQFSYGIGEDELTYDIYGDKYDRWYDADLINEITDLLVKSREEKQAKETFKPKFESIEEDIATIGMRINCEDGMYAFVTYPGDRTEMYKYSQDGYNKCLGDIIKYKEELDKQEERRKKKEDIEGDVIS